MHRRRLTPETYGDESLALLDSLGVIPAELRAEFNGAASSFIEAIRAEFDGVSTLRAHGDCHPGNLLWGRDGGFFLDFDDMVTAPAVQDIWMLVPGRDSEAQRQRSVLLDGYRQLRDFDQSTLRLIEPLRGLRYLHYAAWVARRWSDPAFPLAFPHFGGRDYWSELTADLREQRDLVGHFAQAQGQGPLVAKPRVTVREISYRDEDFQRVLFVRTEVFTEELGADPAWDADGQDVECVHLLAVSPDGRALGSARLLIAQAHTVKISRLSVLSGHRRMGLGRALVEHAARWARERGATGLCTDARVETIGFFAALGFLVESRSFVAGAFTLRTVGLSW